MSSFEHSDCCEVYLCSMPLQQGASIACAVNTFSMLASSSGAALGNSWNKHWLLVFDYGEENVLVCDADVDHMGELTGRTTWRKRAVLESYERKTKLATKRIPRGMIEQYIRKKGDSGLFSLTGNNCQKWAQDLLRELDIQLPPGELDASTVVNDYGGTAVIAGVGLLGVALLGALVYYGADRRNRRE